MTAVIDERDVVARRESVRQHVEPTGFAQPARRLPVGL
jgi:hypothetical protein